MIRFENVSFTYENGNTGIFDMNFTILENECVAFIGESGNGKTTITRVLNGLAPAYYKGNLEGEIVIDGKNICQLPLWEQSKLVGNVFQDPKSGFFSSDLYGEVAFTLENYGVKQRVAIASMLVHAPKVLVFDEPTANLDEEASIALGNEIRKLKEREHTIIIVEHRLAYLSKIVDRYIYIRNGRVAEVFSQQELEVLEEKDKEKPEM